MKLKHYIIEGFCSEEAGENLPCNGTFSMRSYCFDCPQFCYVPSENEFAISSSDGTIEKEGDWIGLGGDMYPSENYDYLEIWEKIWREICRRKIVEAHEEYMEQIKKTPK